MNEQETAMVVSGAMELARMGLNVWLNYQKAAGKTMAEIEAAFQEEKEKMLQRDPANLPDPE